MIGKQEICQAFVKLIEQKMHGIQNEMDAVRESAHSETKSSMGDKYETSREMMMQERNRLSGQLDLLSDQLVALKNIDIEKTHSTINYGSVVETDQTVLFFLSAAVGQLNIEGCSVFAISGEAPIAKAMIGKNVGDSFSFNTKTYKVKRIA